ncbi:MAG TPA: hypothetical protein VN950_28570 [Terriglobales bacterium]|nr:hypothetical protein [Terriglobales bacterium]
MSAYLRDLGGLAFDPYIGPMGLRGKFYLVVMAVLTSAAAAAQGLPEVPIAHGFWDRANKILFASHAALEAVDFGITHHNLSDGGREIDPMAKALCESGTAGQLVFFGGRMAGVVTISYLLHKTGHHKLQRAFPVYASGDSAYGVAYSFAHR